ncbi:uncharacterized protein C12orf40-like [Chiloscyllium plagiosum]|uniref:uncharacterized protein C12orf40-like n=1 Tax=Chiloscyllium plagiosum TaxID=36176 RepID=UPI001CB7F4BD|nr:uncharacterized protein C12orf40-like [Chiloscyllium plagiosum]
MGSRAFWIIEWLFGGRKQNRIKLKQQKKQQKEFFEKRKLKSKFKLKDAPLSPQQNSSVSWDLLTLHIVNRIAAKKEQIDGPNKVTQVHMKKDAKVPIRQHDIELPMSPCSTPSRICLEERINAGAALIDNINDLDEGDEFTITMFADDIKSRLEGK